MRVHFTLHRLRKRVFGAAFALSRWTTFLALVLIAGLGSSWYMVEAGTRLTTRSVGPWLSWPSAFRADADPYTRAHFARSGTLQVSAEIAATYLARVDGDGLKLHSSCEYGVEGTDPAGSWWSLAVFDEHGRLIPNAAERYAFTSDTIARSADGRFVVLLARDARPGNWLPTRAAGRLVLVLTVLDPRGASLVTTAGPDAERLPVIKRLDCR
jgi:hypothetical protein